MAISTRVNPDCCDFICFSWLSSIPVPLPEQWPCHFHNMLIYKAFHIDLSRNAATRGSGCRNPEQQLSGFQPEDDS
jgi:hypothetical protein